MDARAVLGCSLGLFKLPGRHMIDAHVSTIDAAINSLSACQAVELRSDALPRQVLQLLLVARAKYAHSITGRS